MMRRSGVRPGRARHSLAALLFVILATACFQHSEAEDQFNNTLAIQKTTDEPFTIKPGRSIRIPGTGVGTWKEISLSGPRGSNARYADSPTTSSSGSPVFAINVWTTSFLAAWISFS